MSDAVSKKLLLDTNIVLDFMNRREGFYDDARLLMLAGKVGEHSLWITTSQVTDIIFIATEGGKPNLVPDVLRRVHMLRRFVNVYAVTERDIDSMLATTWNDPEDALVFEAAMRLDADAIITRDKGFPGNDCIDVFDCPGFFKYLEDEYGVSYAEVGV